MRVTQESLARHGFVGLLARLGKVPGHVMRSASKQRDDRPERPEDPMCGSLLYGIGASYYLLSVDSKLSGLGIERRPMLQPQATATAAPEPSGNGSSRQLAPPSSVLNV